MRVWVCLFVFSSSYQDEFFLVLHGITRQLGNDFYIGNRDNSIIPPSQIYALFKILLILVFILGSVDGLMCFCDV